MSAAVDFGQSTVFGGSHGADRPVTVAPAASLAQEEDCVTFFAQFDRQIQTARLSVLPQGFFDGRTRCCDGYV